MIVTAQCYADAAASFVGSRFHHHGRIEGRLDCAGIVFASAWRCGLTTPDFTEYAPTPDAAVVMRAVEERCTTRPWCEWEKPGRVIVLRHRIDGAPRHFAVSTGGGLAIHQETRARFFDLRDQRESIHAVMLLKGVEP